jgi:hypothetical protein
MYVNSGKYAFIEEGFVPCVKSAFLEALTVYEKPIHQLWSTSKLFYHADEGATLEYTYITISFLTQYNSMV